MVPQAYQRSVRCHGAVGVYAEHIVELLRRWRQGRATHQHGLPHVEGAGNVLRCTKATRNNELFEPCQCAILSVAANANGPVLHYEELA